MQKDLTVSSLVLPHVRKSKLPVLLSAFLLLSGSHVLAIAQDFQMSFEDVSNAAGLNITTTCGTLEKKFIVEGNGSGCAWIDYNNDGWMDLYIVNGISLENLFEGATDVSRAPNFLFQNNADGTFTEVTQKAGIRGSGLGNGVVAADYNNDGFIDLFVSNYGEDLLYRNDGDGTFTNVAGSANVDGGRWWSTGATFGDYDRDGWVDLYVTRYIDFDIRNPPTRGASCNYRGLPVMCGPLGLKGAPDALYRNQGDGTFREVTAAAGVEDKKLGYGFSAVFEDLDNDGFPDLFVTNDAGQNFLYQNRKDGTFRELALLAGVAYNREGRAQANMGVALGDIGNDGFTDLFVTTFSEDYYPLFRNLGNLDFEEISFEARLGKITIPYLGWATFFGDFDNDGVLDLFMANGHLYPQASEIESLSYKQQHLFFRGAADFHFEDVSRAVGITRLSPKSSRGAAACDYDNDGDLDLVVLAIDDTPALLRNNGGNRGQWIQLRLVGRPGNRSAIGTTVKVATGERVRHGRVRSGGNYLSHNDLRLHFGLGKSAQVDRIEINWPSGRRETLENVKAGQTLTIVEGESIGSR